MPNCKRRYSNATNRKPEFEFVPGVAEPVGEPPRKEQMRRRRACGEGGLRVERNFRHGERIRQSSDKPPQGWLEVRLAFLTAGMRGALHVVSDEKARSGRMGSDRRQGFCALKCRLSSRPEAYKCSGKSKGCD